MAEDPKCAYVRPLLAQPEPIAAENQDSDATWSPEAEAMLARIPGFVRETVRRGVEQAAVREGLRVITLDYMRARRPRQLPFLRPKQPVV